MGLILGTYKRLCVFYVGMCRTMKETKLWQIWPCCLGEECGSVQITALEKMLNAQNIEHELFNGCLKDKNEERNADNGSLVCDVPERCKDSQDHFSNILCWDSVSWSARLKSQLWLIRSTSLKWNLLGNVSSELSHWSCGPGGWRLHIKLAAEFSK